MPTSINVILRERRAATQQLKRELKSVDTEVETVQRRIQSVLNRKSKVPELRDLEAFIMGEKEIDKKLDNFQKSLEQALKVFTII